MSSQLNKERKELPPCLNDMLLSDYIFIVFFIIKSARLTLLFIGSTKILQRLESLDHNKLLKEIKVEIAQEYFLHPST